MNMHVLEFLLLEAAEETHKHIRPAHIYLLRKTYDFFKETGISDTAIQQVMALTSHQMRLIRAAKPY